MATEVVIVVAVLEARRLQLTRRPLQNGVWLLYLKGIIALPNERNCYEFTRARCELHWWIYWEWKSSWIKPTTGAHYHEENLKGSSSKMV